MSVDQVVQVIQGVGFPVAVAAWLLWRGDKRDKQTVEALGELTVAVKALDAHLRAQSRG